MTNTRGVLPDSLPPSSQSCGRGSPLESVTPRCKPLRLFSWNVNGIRAVLKKGALQDFISKYQPDILCLQEIKARPEQVEYDFPGYKVYWNPAIRAGYSGTAILVSSALDLSARNVIHWSAEGTALKGEPLGAGRNIHSERTNLDLFYASETSIADHEGRVLIAEFEQFYLVNVYTPNSKRDLSRLPLREKTWDPEFLQLLQDLEKKKPVVTCGDFNAAHTEMDLARPKDNTENAGFTPEERQGITNLINAGFIDTFRDLHPEEQRYTWWSHWGNARANNVGWRIDYFFISPELRQALESAEIYEDVQGSDHCPVSITLDLEATGAKAAKKAEESAYDFSANRGSE